jgi:ABC-2 type transport system permease protein
MSEQNAGYYKNYITMKNARTHSVLSKILIQAIFTLFMFMTLLASDFIGRSLFFENSTVGDPGFFVKLLLGQFLLQWSYSVLILCVSIITKSMLASISIGIVFVLNVIGMIASSLETLLFDNTYVSEYLLVNTITQIRDFGNWDEMLHVGSVGVVSIVLFTAIAINYKRKEDLK